MMILPRSTSNTSPSTESRYLPSPPPRATRPWALVAPSSVVPRTVVLSVLTVSRPQHLTQDHILTDNTEWVDTKITLDTADPDYINTFGKGEGVSGEMTTEDGGKTWVISDVDIPSYTF